MGRLAAQTISQPKPVYASVHGITYTRSVPEQITIPVAGGCPKCGNPNLMVPEDYSDDTIVTCSKCKYKARWVEFFPRKSTD
jgi:predicted nucleic-acid-binding Zn-ribbon protein